MDICHYSYFKSTSKTKAGLGKDGSVNDHGAVLNSPGSTSSLATVLHPVESCGSEQHWSVQLIFISFSIFKLKQQQRKKQKQNKKQ